MIKSNWENTLINQDCIIRDALKIINNEALKIAIVVDKNKKLLGLVTDGDIRRGLLSGYKLEDKVSKIMVCNPTVALPSTANEELVEIMKAKKILSIPLVKNEIVVGLKTLHETLENPKLKNAAFVMAGGFGKRLRPLTDNCPKPMLKVGDKPILEIILIRLIKAGFSDFYISLHYMPEEITNYFGDGSNWGVSIRYVYEKTPLGTGGALGLLPSGFTELPFVVINGDILTEINFKKLLDFHISQSAEASICVREYEFQIPYGVIKSSGSNIISMEEKPKHISYINAGIYVVNPEVINRVTPNKKIDMPSLLEKILLDGGGMAMFPTYEYWLDIGSEADFARAQMDIRNSS